MTVKSKPSDKDSVYSFYTVTIEWNREIYEGSGTSEERAHHVAARRVFDNCLSTPAQVALHERNKKLEDEVKALSEQLGAVNKRIEQLEQRANILTMTQK